MHAVTIALPSDDLYEAIGKNLREMGMAELDPRSIVDIIDGYIGPGFAKAGPEVKG